jgi:hypothetical protein
MTYPRYTLAYKRFGDQKATVRHTKHKKSFLMRLDGLTEVETPIKVWFSIQYAPDQFNESIKYTDLKQCQKDARIFTAKDEIEFMMKTVS